ncbi:hypothetical protein B0T14DRAFT_106983 [Immersiella caudata]|uniref:Gamma-butyrobetaine hydroxylase-like N-terminal domain-containing protein n=1 Tax=Immersiella caudata TaxID=314043 RepID=A0AA39X3K2_9PEZI|nr:hypothetical protein B0T14DRAFT_106983 [Immersiella caudata]
MLRITNFTRCLARGAVLQRHLARAVSTISTDPVPVVEPDIPSASSAGLTSEKEAPEPPLRKFVHWRTINRINNHHEGLSVDPTEAAGGVAATRNQVLPWIWLRDQCRCASCVNQDTQQRDLKTFKGMTVTQVLTMGRFSIITRRQTSGLATLFPRGSLRDGGPLDPNSHPLSSTRRSWRLKKVSGFSPI